MNKIAFIGAASGWGAQVRETEKGPLALKESGLLDALPFSWVWKKTLHPSQTSYESPYLKGLDTLPYIHDMCEHLSHDVAQMMAEDLFPVIIGGDHSLAMGTWTGVTEALDAQEEFGLLWIDAHMDAHTMATTPSQAIHGMPLAALLGFGEESLVNLGQTKGPVLNPAHVCLIGVRSFEEGEASLLNQLGVRIFYMKEVEERGFENVFQEALDHIKQKTKGFGISIDLDGFDPLDAPGVGTREPHGLKAADVLPALAHLKRDPMFRAFEIVEYNPNRDENQKTMILIRDLVSHACNGKED